MGIIAKTDKGWKTMNDAFAAAKVSEKVRMSAMVPKLGYLLGKANDVEFNIVMVKGVINGIYADDSEFRHQKDRAPLIVTRRPSLSSGQ